MRALAQDEERVAFWRRHTVSGVVLCIVLPAIVAGRTLASPAMPHGTLVLLLAAAVALPSPLLLLVPVERLVRAPRGRLFFDAWEGVGIALVIVFCLLDGGVASPYVLFLFVLLAHAALAYPPAGVALAGGGITAGYLGMGVATGGTADTLVVVSLTLLVATATCAFASANHVRVYERTAAYAQEIAALAERDGLTGTLNHRAFHERLQLEVRRADAGCPVSLLVVDVDSFKTVNDSHGHPVGDDALVHIAEILRRHVRTADAVVSRLGGDELAVLLPGCSAQVAAARAQELVDAVRAAPLPLADGTLLALSISVGVAHAPSHATELRALYAAADAALYAAKRGGRGRASVAAG